MGLYKIKELRVKANLSQQELAMVAGVSRSLIAGLESGFLKETSTATLKKIAKALGCSVSDIFFDEKI